MYQAHKIWTKNSQPFGENARKFQGGIVLTHIMQFVFVKVKHDERTEGPVRCGTRYTTVGPTQVTKIQFWHAVLSTTKTQGLIRALGYVKAPAFTTMPHFKS